MNKYKNDFPILKNNNIVYLDSGATSQKPLQVINAVDNFYRNYNANPHRGAYSLSMEATNLYEDTRSKIAKFINAKHREEIIFSKNATESLNLLAYSYGIDKLKKDDEIVISIMEHHSNLVPWQKVSKVTGAKLKYMYINNDFELTNEEIETKITDKTKIVGIAHVSNVLGTINNVKKIIDYAHKKGAVVIIDASQSIPHMKIDVQELDVDFLVFSGHKMLAPLGIGVLYGKKELLENMNPFIMGGDMIEYVYEQETTFAPLPNKFEAGTQNVEGVIGLGAAIDYINSIGIEEIEKAEKEVVTYARKELSKLVNEDVQISIMEVKNPDLDAALVAENIAHQIENRVSFRIAQKKAIRNTMKAGAKGIKTSVSGRLGGVDMARTEGYTEGMIPLHTLRADVDYAIKEANTTYGKIGVKVWIYKGEILPSKKNKGGNENGSHSKKN